MYEFSCQVILAEYHAHAYQLISQKTHHVGLLEYWVVLRCMPLDCCSHHTNSTFSKSSRELVSLRIEVFDEALHSRVLSESRICVSYVIL
jgi:hypothetical protein